MPQTTGRPTARPASSRSSRTCATISPTGYAPAIGGAEGEIAAALVAGVRAGIPDDVNEALRRTGLAHVLSISGLHMALVAATIMFVLRAGFALFPGFASRRPVKKYRRRRRPRRARRLPLPVRLCGRGRAQLHHVRGHAACRDLRPRRAHHAQPRDRGNRHHRVVAPRGGRAELPDVLRRDRRADRRLCRLGRAALRERGAMPTAASSGRSRARPAAMPGLP